MGRNMSNPTVRVETAETEAAAWHARLGAKSVTTRDIEDFFAWRTAAPANADAYRRVEQIWGQTANLAGDREIDRALDEAMTRRGGGGATSRLSRPLLGLAVASLAVMLVVVGGVWWQGRGAFSTDVGEQRVVQLADGSSVRLDTASRIRVRFDGRQRVITLEDGQAMFDVTHDPSRPFVVQAGEVRVTAVGTVFDVRREADGASVTLISGVVDVASGDPSGPRRMAAGHRAEVDARRAPVIQPVDVVAETSWTDGRIVFRDTPLRTAVVEVNRYLTDPVVLESTTQDRVLINGVFKTGDRDAFVSTAEAVLGLQARRGPDGTVRLSERGK